MLPRFLFTSGWDGELAQIGNPSTGGRIGRKEEVDTGRGRDRPGVTVAEPNFELYFRPLSSKGTHRSSRTCYGPTLQTMFLKKSWTRMGLGAPCEAAL